MGPHMFRKLTASPHLSRALFGALGVTLCACDPQVFSKLQDEQAAGAGGNTGAEGGAGSAGATPAGAGGDARGGAGAGGRATGEGGRAARAGAGGPSTGSSGRTGQAGAGSGGRGSEANGGAGGRPVAEGGAGAAAGGAGAGGAGAGGAGGAAGSCPPADLGKVRARKISDVVLAVPDPTLEISTGPALRVGNRILVLVSTQAEGPLAGRSIAGYLDSASLLGAAPQLSGLSAPLLPDEPVENYVSSQPTSAWLSDDAQRVQFMFTRYYIIAPIGAGLAELQLAQPAPARVVAAVDTLFPPKPAADGGMAGGYRPALLSAGLRLGELRYFYLCNQPPGAAPSGSGGAGLPCRLARVPVAQVADGTRYEFWSDGEWVAELDRATPVFERAASSLSVLQNAYLKRLLAVYSGDNNDLRMAWADAPQGPFQTIGDPIATAPGTAGAIALSYGAMELPVEHADCDPELVLWYSVPVEQAVPGAAPRVRRETHVMRLRLE